MKNNSTEIYFSSSEIERLQMLAKKKGEAIDCLVNSLILEALEDHEELGLSKLATFRDKAPNQRTKHQKAWQ